MKFMVGWSYSANAVQAIIDKWNAGFTKPGENDSCKCLGRWHGVGDNKGFVLYESDDAAALNTALMEWRTLLNYDVTVVLADEDVQDD